MDAGAELTERRLTGGRAKRMVVGIVGGTVLLLGVALIVLPGPAIIVIPAGLAILATEFAWARRWLRKVRSLAGLKESAGDEKERGGSRSRPDVESRPSQPSSR
jgi:hypothetical protein